MEKTSSIFIVRVNTTSVSGSNARIPPSCGGEVYFRLVVSNLVAGVQEIL